MAQAATTFAGADLNGGFVAMIKTRLQQRALYRRTLAELNQLSSRELGDLGLTRSTLRTAAHQAAYGN